MQRYCLIHARLPVNGYCCIPEFALERLKMSAPLTLQTVSLFLISLSDSMGTHGARGDLEQALGLLVCFTLSWISLSIPLFVSSQPITKY
jgi:hypothetical protein